jgi:RES domain-containing protein
LFDVHAGVAWRPGDLTLYRWLPSTATYGPEGAWFGVGRFGTGDYKTLYLAASATGAMAEFFRRNPELLDFQDDGLAISLLELEVEVNGNCLDVRAPSDAALVGIAFDRLTSSDSDEDVRYTECRALAKEALDADMVGLAYPSAAATSAQQWNLVLFGDGDVENGWSVLGTAKIAPPKLTSSDVRPLQP